MNLSSPIETRAISSDKHFQSWYCAKAWGSAQCWSSQLAKGTASFLFPCPFPLAGPPWLLGLLSPFTELDLGWVNLESHLLLVLVFQDKILPSQSSSMCLSIWTPLSGLLVRKKVMRSLIAVFTGLSENWVEYRHIKEKTSGFYLESGLFFFFWLPILPWTYLLIFFGGGRGGGQTLLILPWNYWLIFFPPVTCFSFIDPLNTPLLLTPRAWSFYLDLGIPLTCTPHLGSLLGFGLNSS